MGFRFRGILGEEISFGSDKRSEPSRQCCRGQGNDAQLMQQLSGLLQQLGELMMAGQLQQMMNPNCGIPPQCSGGAPWQQWTNQMLRDRAVTGGYGSSLRAAYAQHWGPDGYTQMQIYGR